MDCLANSWYGGGDLPGNARQWFFMTTGCRHVASDKRKTKVRDRTSSHTLCKALAANAETSAEAYTRAALLLLLLLDLG